MTASYAKGYKQTPCSCGAMKDARSVTCRPCYRARPLPIAKAETDWRIGLRHRFKLTHVQYDEMMEFQAYGCAICGGVNPNGTRLSVDHDHVCCPGAKSCGRCVRALLCSRCNQALGLFREDPAILESALSYIRRRLPGEEEVV